MLSLQKKKNKTENSYKIKLIEIFFLFYKVNI